MASIQDVSLQIVEKQGAAAALVTYKLRGSPQDVQTRRIYRELVELIGVDEGPGEDGQNELIPGGMVFDGAMSFPSTALIDRPPRLLALLSVAFDEDSSPSPFLSPQEDEIRARVTLTEIATPVTANSNVVRRGGIFVSQLVAIPA